jgi:hypothetical protein
VSCPKGHVCWCRSGAVAFASHRANLFGVMFREPIRMKTYKIVVEPGLYFQLPGFGSSLTEDVLVEALAGVVVRELTEDQLGQCTIHVQLRRPSDARALNELVSFAEELGLEVIEAKVGEWVDEATERAILGFFGGGFIGGAAENTVAAITGALAGASDAGRYDRHCAPGCSSES